MRSARWFRLFAIAGVLSAAVVASPAAGEERQKPGSFERHTFTHKGGTLDYMLYVPPRPRPQRPLVVPLPGAQQSAEQVAHDTQFNKLAARKGFFVLYPEAAPFGVRVTPSVGIEEGGFHYNQDEHRHRGKGEPAIIAGLTRKIIADWSIDRRRVFVGGMSNGGAVANVMAVTYPDIYAVVFSHSGAAYKCDSGAPDPSRFLVGLPPYGCTQTAEESALAIRAEMGPRARVMPIVVFHGADDRTVPPKESEIVLQSWLVANDLVDDGIDNGSIRRKPSAVVRRTVPGGHPYTVSYYVDRRGCRLGEYWYVEGMGHAYSGGPPNTLGGAAVDPDGERKWSSAGTDPQGPDATGAAYGFFLNHPQGSRVRKC